MFKKPVKIKSNNLVKGSERKTVKDLFCKSFPKATEQEVNALLNNKKEPLNCIKLVTHDDVALQVYLLQKQPIFFSLRDKIFPTVFLLWKLPHLIPHFTTHPQVMSFISSGADLMLPGVVTPPTLPKYDNVLEGTPVYVNLSNNKAAVAVGVAAQSSFEMERAGGKGKCVKIFHFYADSLCGIDGNSSVSLPSLGPPDWLALKDYDSDFPALGGDGLKPSEPLQELEEAVADVSVEEEDVVEETCDVDELLHYCFLASIKYSKTLALPLLISNFFKLQMLPMCPEGSSLDLKKTSYKKLKPFLEEMTKIGLITVRELKKGVEAITDINKNHPKYSEFYLKPQLRPRKECDNSNQQTMVTESYIITANVLPMFQAAGYHKGDTIEGPSIRKHLTDYIKQNHCQSTDNDKLIQPNTEVLQTICKTRNPITWEEAYEKACESMKSCFKVKSPGTEQILNKGKAQPISMSVKVRSGNKKVTIIDNLEAFGVNINEFAKECQHGVAASTSITPAPPGKKCQQLLVQGNQVVFVHNLLTDKYKIPKRYIRGLELAPKKKK